MKKVIKSALFVFAFFCFFTTAHATINVDAQVDVPANCTITDTDGVTHGYGDSSYLAVCAVDAATKSGAISGAQFSNFSFGLFVTPISEVAANPASQYWALYQNGNFADSGVTMLPVVMGDTILFQLHDFSDNNLGDQVTLHIRSLNTSPISTGGGPLLTYTAP